MICSQLCGGWVNCHRRTRWMRLYITWRSYYKIETIWRNVGNYLHKPHQWLHFFLNYFNTCLMSSEPNGAQHRKSVEVNKPTSYTAKVTDWVPCLPDYWGPTAWQTEPRLWLSWWERLRERSFGSVGCMFIVVFYFFFLFVFFVLRAAAEATRSTHLHLINVKGALNVWGLETIHSYCGRGTAEGQIDICSGGFKVSDLRHSNDTMAQLVKDCFCCCCFFVFFF